MAESTLSLKYSDLQVEVAGFLGYGVESANWTAEKSAEIDRYVQAGVRQFYFPPAVNGVAPHEWSFMKPTVTITTAADDAAQDLPDNFGRILGDLHFGSAVHAAPAMVVGEDRIQALLGQSTDTARPTRCAIRAKSSDGADGQRQEIVWWPIPDAAYVITYRYEAFSGKLSGTNPYPLGGMRHSELIVESCLAVAEQRANDEIGLHAARFSALLSSSIEQDRKMGARYFGHMGGYVGEESVRQRCASESYPVTYKTTTW